MTSDLRKEQEATLARPRLRYSLLAKVMFRSMDLFYGRATTVPKIKLLEIVARIPYQAWELKQYWRLITGFSDAETRGDAEGLIRWSREAQDNEYWHLVVASEKMKQDRIRDSWFWYHFVPPIAAFFYTIFSRLLAFVSIKSAWRLNAMFEDHAEHAFMQFVRDNPQMEDEPVTSDAVQDGRGPDGGRYATWADVFRRIGLDERDHMEESLRRYDMLGGERRMRFLGRFGVWDFLVTVLAAVPWIVFAARGTYAAEDAPVWLLRMAWYGGGLAALELLRLLYSRTVLDHVPAIAVAASYVAAWFAVAGGSFPGLLAP